MAASTADAATEASSGGSSGSSIANLYRQGDYVYVENTTGGPYNVRKIDELIKGAPGTATAKVTCFYRRRDISPSLLLKASDKAERKPAELAYDVSKKEKATVENGKSEDHDEATEPAAASSTTKVNGDAATTENGTHTTKEEPSAPKEDDTASSGGGSKDWGVAGLPTGSDKLSTEERHRLRGRELFLSRQTETIPVSHFRGKCMVTLLSEVETPECYERDNLFFYSLVYDPVAKSLLADKGSIRVGSKHQATIPDRQFGVKKEADEEENDEAGEDSNKENGLVIDEQQPTAAATATPSETSKTTQLPTTDRETMVYQPYHSLTDRDIDQFLVIARAVGTFSRALDTSSSVKLPSLHMTAAAASRDVTLLHAMALLHQADYDIGQAVKYLVPPPNKQHYPLCTDKATATNTATLGGPILCRDQIEEWSAAEANLFEEAIEKYGKDFNDIRNDYLPWKALRDIVEYYYMWKTTSRYMDNKKAREASEAGAAASTTTTTAATATATEGIGAGVTGAKLKQVYVPAYTKPSPHLEPTSQAASAGTKFRPATGCESCRLEEHAQWYHWGPDALRQRVCAECWQFWKKYGRLKRRHELDTYDLKGGAAAVAAATAAVDFSRNGTGNRNGRPSSAASRAGADGSGAGATGSSAINNKARDTFILSTPLLAKVARRLAVRPSSSSSTPAFHPKRHARRPFLAVSALSVKQLALTAAPADVLRVARALRGADPSRMPAAFVQWLTNRMQLSNLKRSGGSANGSNGSGSGEPPVKKSAP